MKTSSFDVTLSIAVATAAGYISAYAYQFSYLSYFGIPAIFVEVNIALVCLVALIALFVMSFFIFGAILVLTNPSSRLGHILRKVGLASYSIFGALFILCSVLILIYNPLSPTMTLLGWATIIAIIVIAAVKITRDVRSGKIYEKGRSDRFMDMLENKLGTVSALILPLSLFFIVCGFAFGMLAAKAKTNFLVPSNDSNTVIISTYSNSFIGLSFNANTKTFGKDVMLFDQDKLSNERVVLTNEKVGPLQPDQTR